MRPLIVSPRNEVWEMSLEFLYWWLYASQPRYGYCFWLVEANFPWGTTSQKHYPDWAIPHLFERLFLISRENNRDCHITMPLSPKTIEVKIKGDQWNKGFRMVQIWLVMRRQYGISAHVSLTSFCRETSGCIAKCQLYSHANRLSGINLTSCKKYWMSVRFRKDPD